MPDILDANGLQLESLPEVVAGLTTDLQSIYGSDANVDQNTQDGQLINIFAQSAEDLRELLAMINAGFDPDQAVGIILDQRVAINNIQRLGGTFTIVAIDITIDRTLSLQGLDANFNNINGTGYTVQDDTGNQYILIDSQTDITAGTYTLDFRAQTLGAVTPTINTIMQPVTVVLGVTVINNASAPLSVGQTQETDAQLRIRRQKSVALASTGYLNGLLGTVLNLAGVSNAVLYENVTNSTDGNGIPAHGIWLVVDGGANTDIGNAIYDKKSYGANMKGSVSVPITTPSGGVFTALFDRPTPEDLYIQFNIQPTVSGASFNQAAIKSFMASNISYTIGQYAETASLTALAVAAINATSGGGVPVDLQISNDGSTWVDYLTTTTLASEFTLSSANIAITVI